MSEPDGRHFYRLFNALGIAAFPLPHDIEMSDYQDSYDNRLSVPPILALLNQSREAQVDNATLLKQIRTKNSNVGRYLERVNDRIDLLQQAILYIDHSFPKLSWQWVNYSEAGVDFVIPHEASLYPSPLQSPQKDSAANKRSIGDYIHLILGIPKTDFESEQQTILAPNHRVYQPQFSPAGFISVICRVVSIEDETAVVRIGCAFERITEFDRQFLARHILAVQSFRRRQSLDSDLNSNLDHDSDQ